jgi:hypothetical protein
LSDHAVELPGDVFDLDIETVVHPLNVFLDLKMLDRLSQFANALQSNKSVGYAVLLSRLPFSMSHFVVQGESRRLGPPACLDSCAGSSSMLYSSCFSAQLTMFNR